MRKHIVARSRKLEQQAKMFEQVKDARAKLDENPTDPEANEAVGRYTCFVKDDWERGLMMIALGPDSPLRTLARRELLLPEDDATARSELADAWWDAAVASESPLDQDKLKGRAVYWYEQALPNLKGLLKARASQRIAEHNPSATQED